MNFWFLSWVHLCLEHHHCFGCGLVFVPPKPPLPPTSIFSRNVPAAGFVKVTPESVYSDSSRFGFDLNTKPQQTNSGVSSSSPFFFSVGLAEGNYRVTARLGDTDVACVTTIKAESAMADDSAP